MYDLASHTYPSIYPCSLFCCGVALLVLLCSFLLVITTLMAVFFLGWDGDLCDWSYIPA